MNQPIEYTIDGNMSDSTRIRLSRKDKLVGQFFQIARDYLEINEIPNVNCNVCPECNGRFTRDDLSEDSSNICEKCGIVTFSVSNGHFKDKDRSNNGGHYIYYKGINLQDAIRQYQGTESKKIKDEVYDILDRDRRYLYPDITDIEMVTRGLVKQILQRNGLSQYFENIQKIYYKYTNRKPPNISHLVPAIMSRVRRIEKVYKKYMEDRTSFMSSQFILYQCLLLEKWKCHEEEFFLTDDQESRSFHKRAWSGITNELDWDYNGIV